MTDTLQQAIAAIKSGDKANGKRLLAQALQKDPDNTQAWLWMSGVVETDAQRADCLRQVLRIDPNHPHAAAGLAKLSQAAPQPEPEPEPPSAPEQDYSFDVEVEVDQEVFGESEEDDFSAMFAVDETDSEQDFVDIFQTGEADSAESIFGSSEAFSFDAGDEAEEDDFSAIFGIDETSKTQDLDDLFPIEQDDADNLFPQSAAPFGEAAPFDQGEEEDFLAGLDFSDEGEDDIPDWQRSLGGEEEVPFQAKQTENYWQESGSIAGGSYQDTSYEYSPYEAESSATLTEMADSDQFPEDSQTSDPLAAQKRPKRSLAWYQVWLSVMGSPSEKSFHFILSDTKLSMDRGLIWMFCAALVQYIVVAGLLYFVWVPLFRNLAVDAGLDLDVNAVIGGMGLLGLILIPIGASAYTLFFALQSGILHLIAKLFGGRGSFEQLVFATAAFQAPLLIISIVAVFIPYLNFCLGPILAIYGLLLMINALKAVYRFGTGSAVVVLFLPGIIFIIIGCVAGFVLQGMFPVEMMTP